MSTVAAAIPARKDSPDFTARTASAFYVLNIATILASIVLVSGIVVSGDPSATAANLSVHEARFRTGIALQLVSTAASLGVAAFLYQLFNPVQSGVSLLAACYLAALAGVGGLIFLAPPLATRIFPAFAGAGLVFEISLALWLLLRGVK